jgi:alpha-tubulin suppressor-like RCC1 family protein
MIGIVIAAALLAIGAAPNAGAAAVPNISVPPNWAYEPFCSAVGSPPTTTAPDYGWVAGVAGNWGYGNVVLPTLAYGSGLLPAPQCGGWARGPSGYGKQSLSPGVTLAPQSSLVLRALFRVQDLGAFPGYAILGNLTPPNQFDMGHLGSSQLWGLRTRTTSGGSSTCLSTHPIVANVTVLLVAQLDLSTNVASLWVNPPGGSLSSGTADCTISNAAISAFNAVYWQVSDPVKAVVDEIGIDYFLPSTTTTEIHNAAHQAVTTVAVGTQVHDTVQVSGSGSGATPTGNVTIDWLTDVTDNTLCTGILEETSLNIPLSGGSVEATGFPQVPLKAGFYAFQAHYAGDSTHGPSVGPCEPLRVLNWAEKFSVWGDNSAWQLSYETSPFNSPFNVASVMAIPIQAAEPTEACSAANLDDHTESLAAGGHHSLALVNAPGLGRIVCAWGAEGVNGAGISNDFGQLGRAAGSPTNDVPAPVCRPMNATSGVCDPNNPGPLSGVTKIAAGGFFSLALLGATNNMPGGLPAGTVVAWGSGINGELGNGGITSVSAPVAVRCKLGTCGGDQFLKSAELIAAGTYHALVKLSGSDNNNMTDPNNSTTTLPKGTVVSWGDNTRGELGYGQPNNSGLTFPGICTDHTHDPGLSSYCSPFPNPVIATSTYCGYETSTHYLGSNPLDPVRELSAGGFSGLAALGGVNSNGNAVGPHFWHVCSWGDNTSGQLGAITLGVPNNGATTTSPNPCWNNTTLLNSSCRWSAGLVQRWINPVPTTDDGVCRNGNSGGVADTDKFMKRVVHISAGGNFNLAIRHGGAVCAWGNNGSGQLGTDAVVWGSGFPILFGTWSSCPSGACSVLPVKVHTIGGDGSPNFLTDVRQIRAGFDFAVALVGDNSSAVSWGNNLFGQLGNGVYAGPPVPHPERVCRTEPPLVPFLGTTACNGNPLYPYLTQVKLDVFDAGDGTFTLAQR